MYPLSVLIGVAVVAVLFGNGLPSFLERSMPDTPQSVSDALADLVSKYTTRTNDLATAQTDEAVAQSARTKADASAATVVSDTVSVEAQKQAVKDAIDREFSTSSAAALAVHAALVASKGA